MTNKMQTCYLVTETELQWHCGSH